jgi:hypothetical protein
MTTRISSANQYLQCIVSRTEQNRRGYIMWTCSSLKETLLPDNSTVLEDHVRERRNGKKEEEKRMRNKRKKI